MRGREEESGYILHRQDRAEAEVLSLTLRLAVLADVTRLLGSEIPTDEVCRSITNLVPTVIDAEAASTLLFDPQTSAFTTVAVAGDRAHAVQTVCALALPSSIAHWVAAHKEPLALVFPANDHRFSPEIDALQNWPLRSLACVPMLARDQVVGVIQVFNRRESPLFSDAELDLLSALANQAALIVENARLIESLAERNRQLSSLIEVSRKVASSLDLRTVLTEILNAAIGVLGGNAASILLVDKETHELFFEATLGDKGLLMDRIRLPAGRGIAAWVLGERQPLYVRDAPSDPRFDPSVSRLVGLEVRSLLVAPLNVHNETIGVIEVINPPEGEEAGKLALISSFADHASLAVNNARLLQEAREGLASASSTQITDALAAEKQWSASIEQAIGDGVVLVDGQGYLLRANPAARAMLQLPEGTLPNLVTVIPDPSFASALATRPEGLTSLEFSLGEGPRRRHLQARFFQLPSDQALIAFSDLSAQKTLEEMHKDLRFFASHALFAPLSAIKKSTEALLSGGQMPDDSISLLRLVRQECDTLLQLVDSLGRLTEVEAGVKLSLVPLALSTVVEKALATGPPDLAQRQVRSQIPPDLPAVAADPERLPQVLLILLSNAIKYSPPGSPITIKACRHFRRYVALSVSDEGIGISEAEIPLIFNKYYAGETPSPAGKGTGLGLYLVKQLIEAHKGKIRVKSKPGKGSTFTIILPITQEQH